jgi:hypothetical protein
MTRRIPLLLALAALVALAVAPSGVAGSKKLYKLSRGTTTVTLNADTANALSGIAITALKPAKAGTDAGSFTFPVTNGRVLGSTVDGKAVVNAVSIKHVGGLKLSKDDKSVAIRNLWVTIKGDTKLVTAQLVGGKRFDLATIEGGSAPVFSGKNNRNVTVSDVTLKLTKDAADGLTAAFGLAPGTVAEGTELGTASITTRLIGKGPKGKPAKPTTKPAKPAPKKPHTHTH